jgi:hypothetical protein
MAFQVSHQEDFLVFPVYFFARFGYGNLKEYL